MKRTESRRGDINGISMPMAAALIVVATIVAASSVVILGVEIGREAVDDEVLDPFFHMKAEPMHQNASVMEKATYKIWFDTDIYLYTPIKLEVMDMFDGVVSYIDPDVIYPGENATLELTATFEGDFFREVVGSYNGLKDSVRVTLSVKEESQDAGFELEATPDEHTAFPYQWVYYLITVETSGDFHGMISLSVEEFYDCCLTSLQPKAIYPGQAAVLGLSGMIPGEFTRNVTGTHGSMTSRIEVELHVMMETYVPK